jgi:manganese/iron transport system permease protein
MRFVDQLGSPLLQRALLEACLVSALCGVVGVHVLLRKLPFFTLALSHATLPGVVVAGAIGVSLYLGGVVAAACLVVAVAVLGSARRLDTATATGVALSAAFAAGVLLQSTQPSGGRDLAEFLVGDVLTVSATDVWVTVGVGTFVIVVLAALHKDLVFSVFDPTGAAAAGYRLLRLELIVLGLVGLTVVTAIPAVGTILVVALLVTLPLAARQWVDRLVPAMAVAAGLGVLSGFLGVAASAQWGIAAGAAIVLAATGLLGVSLAAAALRRSSARRAVLIHSQLPG